MIFRLVGGVFVVVASVFASSCNPDPENGAAVPETTTITETSLAPPSSPAGPHATETPEEFSLAAQVAALEAETGAEISLALSDGTAAGSLEDDTAWSTIKVPLALAAYRQDESFQASIDASLTVSDNASAQRLWDSLGGGEQAAAAVEAVLREAGDLTAVQPHVTREGFTAFGQTAWAPQDQAKFAAALPQLEGAEAVLGPMGRVAPSQSYGLGQLPDAAFKGGWGPDPSGRYLTRQFGVVGDHGVAVAVIPADGTYESGQRILDRIVQDVLNSVEEAG